MHAHPITVKMNDLLASSPIRLGSKLAAAMWLLVFVGIATFTWGLITQPHELLWAAYFINVVFFMGVSVGGTVLSAIFQIVRATWSGPVRRIGEASSSFIPWIFVLWAATYFGREHLYPWARGPMPGREWWMQPNFVYGRFVVLLGVLFYVLRRFVRLSLRGDVGLLRERGIRKDLWKGSEYDALTAGWSGSEREVPALQRKLSYSAPVVIICYAVIYSLFAFEMIMSMDTVWYANMFGGFTFIGALYLGWALLSLTVILLSRHDQQYGATVSTDQLWDLGKMTFAFCMLWGYLFFAHFLPQWYGNLPEETQWLILRTREYPWKGLAWAVFPMCFIIPFLTLLSRDLKKSPQYFSKICILIIAGLWLEKYLTVMPQFSPSIIPFGALEVGLFLGFAGAYVLSVRDFLARFPALPLSHPLTHGVREW